jgi:hypothetical protein
MTNLTIIGGSLKTPTIAERLQDGGIAVHQGRNYGRGAGVVAAGVVLADGAFCIIEDWWECFHPP